MKETYTSFHDDYDIVMKKSDGVKDLQQLFANLIHYELSCEIQSILFNASVMPTIPMHKIYSHNVLNRVYEDIKLIELRDYVTRKMSIKLRYYLFKAVSLGLKGK